MRKSIKQLCLSLLFVALQLFSYSQCLNYSTFFGTIFSDDIKGVCSDTQNNLYVIGNTYNTDLPTTVGAFQGGLKGNNDIFLAKFDSCGILKWCTYFGTSGFDNGEKLTYSNDNTIVLTGYTDGSDLDTTGGCFQPKNNGGSDCFLAKFSLSGQPVWITYFGDAGGDFAYDVKTDSLNNIVIGGTSLSNSLYTNANSFQQTQAGATDAFIARFNSKGILKFSTFYGGTNSEDIHAIAIDKFCNIIGVGGSFSFNLSTSVGCHQSVSNGGMEIYVIKLDSTGQRKFSTYIGTPGTDDAYGVCTDNANYIYISGHTSSNLFFTTPGAFQPNKAGLNDGYCLSLSPAGSLLWSTFLGGTGNDFNTRMHINKNKELVVLYKSQSTNFPMLGAGNNTVNAGAVDNVVIKLLTNGLPFWSTYIGGTTTETAEDIVSFSKTKIAIVGTTNSSDYPLSGTVYQNTFGGTEDGFVTCYNAASSPLAFVPALKENSCKKIVAYNSMSNYLVLNKLCDDNVIFNVYDVCGRLIKSGETEDNSVDFSELSNGIYICFVTNEFDNGSEHIKFIKR